MIKNKLYISAVFAIVSIFSFSNSAFAASTDFEFSGWIPYWKASQGISDAKKHLDLLDKVYPFVFGVKQDGSLNEYSKLSDSSWKRFVKSAKSEGVKVIPTVMWSDGQNIHKILSDSKLREGHIKIVAEMLKKGKYDGVDIDYEGKLSSTIDYYSVFLKDLKKAIGSKELVCTIEARTPPDSLYKVIPARLEYANDYKVIGEVCDRVQIMAYDQQRADLKLNDARTGAPYAPISDIDWVRKVIDLAVKSIPKEKIVLGVATYGREWEVTVFPNWYQGYKSLNSVTAEYATDFADDIDKTPSRNTAGEMSLSYFPDNSAFKILDTLPVPANTSSGNESAARALMYANATGQNVNFNLMWWSDASAIEDKIKLAKEKGLRGIAIFKLDKTEDQDVWDLIDKY